MNKKSPVDRLRDSSGYADISTLDDGAIIEMLNLGGRLLIIKERSIYEMEFADNIDPERTNINLPLTIHKLIIDKGTESEVVARTFLTAKKIFKPEYLNDKIDCNAVLSLVIDMLSEIFLLENTIQEYSELESQEIEKYKKREARKTGFQLPSIMNLESRCKTIFQKTYQIEQILMNVITHFYPSHGLDKKSKFPQFYEVMKSIYGDNDSFPKFIEKTVYFMDVIRYLRNGLDHFNTNYVKVTNFELLPNGNILSPTIELNHKKVKLERMPLNG